MALEAEYETIHGVRLDKAFFKVVQVQLKYVEERRKWYTRYTMAVYADRSSRRLDKEPVDYQNFLMKADLTGGKDKENIITLCYNNFKQQHVDTIFDDV
jgi:hypothetical protein